MTNKKIWKWDISDFLNVESQHLIDTFGLEALGIYHYLVAQMFIKGNLFPENQLRLIEKLFKPQNFKEIIERLIELDLIYYQGEFLSSRILEKK